MLWHTSAHKGSPVFHRRAPGMSTANPEGSPGRSRGKRPGDPSGQRKQADDWQLLSIVVGGETFSPVVSENRQGAHAVIEGVACLGYPIRASGPQLPGVE